MATSVHNTITSPAATLADHTPTVSRRLESLDVFRGLTIAGMILVNNPGSDDSYWPLDHADELASAHPSGWYSGKWWVDANGWTPTDLIFPFFLFIVGTSMVMSFAARRARGDSRLTLMKHAVRRSALILLIGYAIRILPYVNFSHMRYPGVLQRIAVVYLCASGDHALDFAARAGHLDCRAARGILRRHAIRFSSGMRSLRVAYSDHNPTLHAGRIY